MKKPNRKMGLTAKIAAISLVIFIAAGISWFVFLALGGKKDLPVLGEAGHRAGAFSFVNQDGERITEKSVQRKVTIAEYFFTSCPSICPVMNANLKEVYEKFKNNPDFVILSHTVDPERDSVPVMKTYAKKFDAQAPAWEFLTGSKKALYASAYQDYLLAAADSGTDQFIHTQYVALLDKNRRIRGFYDMTNKENLLKLTGDIQQLLKDDSN